MDQTYRECIKLMNICQKVVPNVSEVEKSGKVVRGRTRMLYKVHKHKMLPMILMHKHKMHLHKMLCPMSPK